MASEPEPTGGPPEPPPHPHNRDHDYVNEWSLPAAPTCVVYPDTDADHTDLPVHPQLVVE